MKTILAIAVGCAAMIAGAAEPEITQTITLKKGWNAVYLRVAPTASADELFASWPVKWVALYNPADFTVTRQFSDSEDGEGTKASGYRVWRRKDAAASTFMSVPPNSVLVTFATDAWSGDFHGVPMAPRVHWHDSLTEGTMNLVGFSVYEPTTTDRYFSGLEVGDGPFYVFAGGPNGSVPQIMPTTMAGAKAFSDGEVLLVDSKKTSDWSGVLNVSPATGLDFGTEGSLAMLSVRNDGTTARKVSVTVQESVNRLPEPELHWRDADLLVIDGAWKDLKEEVPITKTLAAGETWRIQVAVDRSKFGNAPSGTVYGAILRIRDESEPVIGARNVQEGGSRMHAFVPLRAEVGDGERTLPWPFGLWMTVAELDTVTFMITKDDSAAAVRTGDLPSGGKMKVRLPLYVDRDGKMTILQRFWFGRDTNGVLRVLSGAVEKSKEPLTQVKRVSTPFLPTDHVQIGVTEGVFGVAAGADFTVEESSFVNPMRHAQHPQHDGLTADYGATTPSGDELSSYLGSTKPEMFSITNHVRITWDEHTAATWNPEETLTGSLEWAFDGLRHEGPVRAKGRFVMKLLTKAPVELK